MAAMLLKSLHAFDKKRLKHTDTHVKTIEGKHFVEKRDPNGEVKTEMMEGTTYGYVVSYVYDLQVGEILPNLIIGSQDVAAHLSILERYNVTHILNLASCVENFYPEQFQYKYIKIEDYPEAQILPHFETAFEFINEGIQSGFVLVHCNAGVSRSVTVVVAYLMKTKNMSLKQALDLVKTKRPTMCPNEGFQTQLQTYEDILRPKKTKVCDKGHSLSSSAKTKGSCVSSNAKTKGSSVSSESSSNAKTKGSCVSSNAKTKGSSVSSKSSSNVKANGSSVSSNVNLRGSSLSSNVKAKAKKSSVSSKV